MRGRVSFVIGPDRTYSWVLEMPTPEGEWETTPFRDLMDRQVERLADPRRRFPRDANDRAPRPR